MARCIALTLLIRTVHLQLCAQRCSQGSSIGLPSIAKLAADWLLLPPVLIIHTLLVCSQPTVPLQGQASSLSKLVPHHLRGNLPSLERMHKVRHTAGGAEQ